MKKFFFRRLLATVLTLAMLVSVFPQTMFASEGQDEVLIAELMSYSDEYPDGAFAFYNPQMEASEGDGSMYIDIVRLGSMNGEASVTFKAIDISAVYGKDYTLSVEEGFFVTRELEQDYDAEPLVDLFAETTGDIVIGNEEPEEEATENVVEIGISPEEGIVSVNEEFEEADETEEAVEEVEEEATGLRAAWSESTGKKSNRKSWKDVADNAEAKALAEEMSENNGYIEEFAKGLPGTAYTLSFEDGEYLKRIKVDFVDDNVSESEEQVMFVLMNETGADISMQNTAYLNILDNEANEPVIFSLPDGALTVFPEDEFAYINVERISGMEKFASVVIGTGAITAVPGKDYEAGSIEVIFPQGVKSRTIKVPVYDMNRGEDVTFAVAIDAENSFADPSTSSVAVTIKGNGVTSEEEKLSLMSAEETFDGMELFAVKEAVNVNKSVKSPSDGTGFGSAVKVASLDLRNATRIDIEYTASGSYSYTYQVKEGSGCKEKTVNKTGTRTGKEGNLKIGSRNIKLPSDRNTVVVDLTANEMANNKELFVSARRTESGNSGAITYTINRINVYYEEIHIEVVNTPYEGFNIYTEKVYEAGGAKTDNGLTYNDGNTIQLGEGRVKGDTSYVATRYTDAAVFSIGAPSENEKTTQGVRPVEGVNVYHAGWRVLDEKNNTYYEEIIKPDEMNLETLYAKYKHKSRFRIRPVIYPYSTMMKFNNSNPETLAYTNNISNGKEVKATMLDTFNVTGVGINNSGYVVEQFIINGYKDSDAHNSRGTARANAADKIRGYEGNEITDFLNKNVKGTNEVLVEANSADPSKIIIMPDCDAIYLDMAYTRPKIEVMYNPSPSAPVEHKAEGNVFYYDAENPENSTSGKWDKIMQIRPVSFGNTYTIQAVYSDSEDGMSSYKTVWQDFTGDMNGDGMLTLDEQRLLAQYKLDRGAVASDAFTYMPRVTNSMIYYYFAKRTKAPAPGYIYGTVLLKQRPIFGSEDVTYTPINGATVTVDGITVSTTNDEVSGDGYFAVSDRSFVSGEAHRVNVIYGSLSTAASQQVNVEQAYILDPEDIISVSSASRAKDGKMLAEEDYIYNDDANYTLSFVTNSTNSALIATKAVLKFYRTDGTYITEKEYSSVGELTGIFECTFNPKTIGLPPGGSITVTFIDNEGTSYFELDTGISLVQSLGALSLIASFAGKAAPAIQVIGEISSAFNFGWDGNLDESTEGTIGDVANYSITIAEGKKILNLGLEFATEGDNEDDDDDDKDDDKDEDKDKDKGKTKKEVKDAAKAEASDGDKAEADKVKKDKKEAAEAADNGKNETKNDVAVGFSANFSFGITLTLAANQDGPNKGQWYFEEFMIVVNAGAEVSVSKSFVTPIGIPIIIGATIGVEGQAIVVVERVEDSAEYYMADLAAGDLGTIDLINKGQSLKEYMFIYGDFTVAPYISLTAGVGVEGFNISLTGRADFTFNYNTKTDKGSGKLAFSCSLQIELLIFKTSFNLGSTEIDLFSQGANLYESLDTFRVSEREYLANRSGWNSNNGDLSLFAVAGLAETELLHGVNPHTDTQLAALDDGKYISVFIDDVPSRSAENSMAVYYSIYDGNSWSEAEIIDDDGTLDDSPVIHDLENGKLFVAWSSANEIFDENCEVLDVLNARDIKGAFVDKATGEIGEIMDITMETEDDVYADNNVKVAYDSETERMVIYYTKSEYAALDGGTGSYGDAVYPYDVIAYRIYDVNIGEFIDTGDSPDGDWYGQVLLDLAPSVVVNETLDGNGYWVDTPEITEYVHETDEDGYVVDPIVVESDAIAYNGLSLFAYILDYDGDKSTTTDRDVFMQIYNFEENSISHPIMITSNNVEEKSLQFERVGGAITFLSYISDGTVKMFDVSSNISQESVTREEFTEDGILYYYLDKSRESGYIPEMIAIKSSGGGDYSGEQEIVDFDIKTGSKYFYIMFTERTTKLREGIEEGSEEALLPENNLVETQIYMTRYDFENSVLTNPVSVTEEEGANYANIAFAVTDGDGGFVAMATKSMATVEEIDGELFSTDGSNESGLYSIMFMPDANVTIENPTIDDIEAGRTASGSFKIYNGGLETIEGLTVEVRDADGNVIDLSDSGLEEIKLFGGESRVVSFGIPVADDANTAEFTAVVKDSDGVELDTITHSEKVSRILDVVIFNAEITDRGIIEFNAVVKNNMPVASGEKTFTISAGETKLYTVDVESLNPGESKNITGEIKFDYNEIFESVQNEDGSVSAETVLTATAGNENLTDTVSLLATADQMARMNAVTDVSFASNGKITLDKGKFFDLAAEITADDYSGRYEDNNEEDVAAQGVTVKYISDNENVAKVYESGYIEGISNGKTVVTALLMPADSTYDGEKYISDYPTLPNEAIKAYTFTVNVGKTSGGGGGSSSGGSGGGSSTATQTVKINTGDGEVESVKVNRNSTIGSIEIPTKEGYEFDGWYKDEALTIKADSNAKITADTTLYVKWTEKSAEDKDDDIVWFNPFADVNTKSWFYDSVKFANENGLMNGTSESVFSPNDDLTRAMLVTILYRADDEPDYEAEADFDDIKKNAYYADAVAWAKENGIVTGISDKEFAPDNKITREQIATIMFRYAVYKGIDAITMEENLYFDDADEISKYAVSAMNWMVGQEIIKGYVDNTVGPKNNATRAEAATMLKRFIEKLEAIEEAKAEAEEAE